MKTILFIMIGLSSLLTADFSRDANGIVSDNSTGLQWQDNAIGSMMNWQSAIDNCEALSLGGYQDWRLPNLNELTSLVDERQYNPTIDDVFVNTRSSYYVSSTTYANDSSRVWDVDFYHGNHNYGGKIFDTYVRCVRAGE